MNDAQTQIAEEDIDAALAELPPQTTAIYLAEHDFYPPHAFQQTSPCHAVAA